MKITAESELMKNQKHADVMAPDVAFEVLQTPEGDALFFSIGTDHVFYVTREVTGSQTGWTKIDLSSVVSASHGGAPVSAKSFALAQNAQTMAFDLALVITVADIDYLYLSLNHSNAASAWANGVLWTAIPFDAASIKAPNPLTIADVYLMNIPSTDGADQPAAQNCFVDILREPGNNLELLDRYYIQLSSAPHWIRHTLAADLKAGSITSCLGNRTNDRVPGIYTFGVIGKTQELIYAPQYNYFSPTTAPNTARLNLPPQAASIASASNSEGITNLFVAAENGLYLFTPDNQYDQAKPVLVVPATTGSTNNIFAGVTLLAASTVGSRSVIWGLNAQGSLFHIYCPVGSEKTASAWSSPILLCSGVERFAFYLNTKASNNVLFAHLSGQQLVQLIQDPVTSHWNQHNILLPPTSIDKMIEYNSFTTHIKISDDNGAAAANTAVTLTSTSPVTVYVNDVYHVLTPTVPIDATADVAGTITVIQETQSLSAVSFQVIIQGSPAIVALVDPLSKAIQKLSDIKTGDDLSKVQITTPSGTQQSLIPTSVSSGERTSAARSIVQLLQVKATLPLDGSVKAPSSVTTTAVSRLQPALQTTQPLQPWGATCGKNGLKYHEGDSALQNLNVSKVGQSFAAKSVSLNLGTGIKVAAGDFFKFLKSAWEHVESFVIQESQGLYHFAATVAGKVYDAVLDCVSAVVGAIEFVFNQIKVAFEDIIAWLGFVFKWDDILRTHKVIKNVLKQYAYRAIGSLHSFEQGVNSAFDEFQDKMNAWAGITDPCESIGTQQQAGSSIPGSNSPQFNWAMYHTKNGLSSADTSYKESDSVPNTLDGMVQDLEALVLQEEDYFKTVVTQIKEEIVDKYHSLTPGEIVKKLSVILGDLVMKTAGNFIVKLVEIIKLVVTGLLDCFDAPLDIPILSRIYKGITGDELSFLDLVCLVGSIPATLFYKLIAGKTPFPEDSHTSALINAPDFKTISTLLSGKSPVSSSQTQSIHGAKSVLAAPPISLAPHALAKVAINSNDALATPSISSAPHAPAKDAIDTERAKTANIVFNFLALPGAFLVAICAGMKRKQPESLEDESPPVSIRFISAGSYLAYIGPDISGAFEDSSTPYTIWNDVVTSIAFVKVCADNNKILSASKRYNNYIGPFLETCINVVWLGPDIWALVAKSKSNSAKASDKTSFTANLLFDIGGMLTIGTSAELTGHPLSDIIFVASQAFTMYYGALCVVGAGLQLADK